jgi:hypothetical protein
MRPVNAFYFQLKSIDKKRFLNIIGQKLKTKKLKTWLQAQQWGNQ